MTALLPQEGPVIAPGATDLSRPFWDGCSEKQLLFQRCDACGAAQFDPAHRCRWCQSARLDWEESAGRGVVTSWTVVWRPVLPTYTVPYAPAVIELDEGYHMVASLVGCDHTDVRTGMRVVVTYHADDAGVVLPYFEPDLTRKEAP